MWANWTCYSYRAGAGLAERFGRRRNALFPHRHAAPCPQSAHHRGRHAHAFAWRSDLPAGATLGGRVEAVRFWFYRLKLVVEPSGGNIDAPTMTRILSG